MRTKEQRLVDAKKIRKLLENNKTTWQNVFGADNIHVDKHADRSDISMASKAAFEGRSVSTFPDDKTMNECVCNAIAAYADIILKETEDEKPFTRKVLTVDLDEEEWCDAGITPTFKGIARTYDGKLQEMTTNSIDIIYKADPHKPFGFSIVSAFPNVNCPEAKPTGKNIAPLVKSTKGYQTASPLKRAWIDHALNPDAKLNMQYVKNDQHKTKRNHEQIVIVLPAHNQVLKHRIFIENKAIYMQTLETTDYGTKPIHGIYQQLSRQTGLTPYQKADLSIPEVRERFIKDFPKESDEILQVEQSKKVNASKIKIARSRPKQISQDQQLAKLDTLFKQINDEKQTRKNNNHNLQK